MMKINFYNQTETKYLPGKILTKGVEIVALEEIRKDCEISIIICTDEFIHDLNKNYLGHDYPTDVITFEIESDPLIGEIYISIDTAISQSADYKVSLKDELLRLAVHGALHLAGHIDTTDLQRKNMAALEDKFINRIKAKPND